MGRMGRAVITGCAALGMLLSATPAWADELLIRDETFTFDTDEHGFHFFAPPAGAPADWTAPADYYQGDWHRRYEVISAATDRDFQLQVCVWVSDGNEICSERSTLTGPGDVVTTSSSPAGWWTLSGPVDFSRPDLWDHLGMPLWADTTCLVSDWPTDNCWENHPDYLPMQLRLTVVAVSDGDTFSGWDCWINGNCAGAPPIALHPDNGHYFIYGGQPLVLVTSAEHYGAVMNLDFDYLTYLDTLALDGLNYTRIFTGAYVENPGWFDYPDNQPISPAPGRVITPWARSATAGYTGGGNLFDLDTWDDAYFTRLRDFVAEAGARGIIVEVTLFSAIYTDLLWDYSPMKASNNVSGVGNCTRQEALTLSNDGLLPYQTAMVEKIVTELRDYPNVFYEICNEPYINSLASDDWQATIIDTIVSTEAAFTHQHLIAQNINNHHAIISSPDPDVSIFNFHYTYPYTVTDNYALNRVIGNDETGFSNDDLSYRVQGWQLVLSGAGLQNVLDLSFLVGEEDGPTRPTSPTQAGGGPALRQQMGILKAFIHGFNFIDMAPDKGILVSGVAADNFTALVQAGQQYAIHVEGGTQIDLTLSLAAAAEPYEARWIDTKTGAVLFEESFSHAGGNRTLSSPTYSEDVALAIVAGELNDAPSVAIVSPLPNAQVASGADVEITATASDTDGTVTLVEFFADAAKIGEDATAPYAFTWSSPADGDHQLSARATDDGGATTTSVAVPITVGESTGPVEEFVVYDGIFTYVEADHGYHTFPLMPDVPEDWLSPVDFYQGTFHFRYEVIDQPTNTPGRFNVVFRGDINDECIASTQIDFSGPGAVATDAQSPSATWQCASGGVDFSRPLEFSDRQLLMRTDTGCRVSDWVSECWDDRASYLPMEMRLTIVAVADAATFSGWDYWLTARTPVIEPPGGTYAAPVTVSISTATPGATLRYTLDGSDPDTTSTTYAAPFEIDADTTVRARAFRDDLSASGVASASYVIAAPTDGGPQPEGDADATGGDTASAGGDSETIVNGVPRGACDCQAGPVAPLGWLLGLALAWRRRRRGLGSHRC